MKGVKEARGLIGNTGLEGVEGSKQREEGDMGEISKWDDGGEEYYLIERDAAG